MFGSRRRTAWPLPEGFGTEEFEVQVDAVTDETIAELEQQASSAQKALRVLLGESGFLLLDTFLCAHTAVAAAREEAVATVAYSHGLGAGAAWAASPEATPVGAAVVGAVLCSPLPPGVATRGAAAALSAIRSAISTDDHPSGLPPGSG